MGEPGGIGPDVTLQAWLHRDEAAVPPFVALACPHMLADRARTLSVDVAMEEIGHPRQARACFSRALPVLPVPLDKGAKPGKLTPASAAATIASIEQAVELTRAGHTDAVVTNPIHKAALYEAGFAHTGHTDFLEALAGQGARAVMMLAVPGLRVVPVTVHLPLADVPGALTSKMITTTAHIVAHALKTDFAIPQPRLAVTGLNPHAGESGALGREEIEIIEPALQQLKAEGLDVTGPYPADTAFHDEARAAYDAALCMYHDQALIPLKTLNFFEGVNVTLGLPFVRTSPDHGTALDIAGTGKADPRSLIAALKTAASIAQNRAARPAAA